jgi:chromosome partitioning protein
MILLIGGEKGGTGKTTLVTNLAALRGSAGRDVLVVDTDVQGSASYWASIRDESNLQPRVSSIQKFGKGLIAEVRDLSNRYQDLIIDAGGRDSVELRSAMVAADQLVIPLQASQFDVWTLERMAELVTQARGLNDNLIARVVINRASSNPMVAETREAQLYLSEFPDLSLLRTVVRDRVAYRRAAGEGCGVAEMPNREKKAVAEMQLLYEEIYGEHWVQKTSNETNGR